MWTKIRKHLRFEWIGYVLILAVSCLWIPIINRVTAPKRNECVSIVFIGENFDAEKLQTKVVSVLPALTSEKIKQISVTRTDLTALYKDQELYSIADQADIIIFEESKMSEASVSFYFDCIKDSAMLTSLNAETYSVNEAVVGVRLDGRNNFSSYYHGTEKCTAVFGYKSQCLGTLNGVNGNEAGLRLLEWLLAEV